jgi:cytochrome c biogenesis protein CcdA
MALGVFLGAGLGVLRGAAHRIYVSEGRVVAKKTLLYLLIWAVFMVLTHGAAVFGFMFGLVSLPCTGPALLLIISVIPVKGAILGGIMMIFYGFGHCLLILVVGTSAGAARHILGSTKLHKANLVVKKAAGALLALVGVYIGVGTLFPQLGLGL